MKAGQDAGEASDKAEGNEQDDDLSNDSEPIEWVIVDQAGERVLLLSRRILDVQAYNSVDDAAACKRV